MTIKNWFFTATIGIVNLAAIIFGLALMSTNKNSAETSNQNPGTAISNSASQICSNDMFGGDGVLDIGVLNIKPNPKENYDDLADYLESEIEKEFNCDIEVNVHGIWAGAKGSLLQAKQEIQNKNWDLAFTTLPMTAIAAEDNNYTWVAQMFPDRDYPYGRGAIIVRKDSKIQSFNDIESDDKLLLGKFSAPALFHLPLYDLYGKSLKVDRQDLNPFEIKNAILKGEADLAGFPIALIKQKDPIRVISESREIALGSVYLSPKLNETEQNTVKKMLFNAPDEVSTKAFYKKTGTKIDYTESAKVFSRVDELLGCINLQAEPVNLFCENPPPPISHTKNHKGSIIGKINGYRRIGSDSFTFTLRANGKIYSVEIPESILDQHPDYESIPALYEKRLKFTDVEPKKFKDSFKLKITRVDQLEIIQ